MKKMISNIKTMAALLMAGATFTACSSDNDMTAEQPVQPTEPQVYTMVIKASKGSDAQTRALALDGTTLKAYWSGEETIEVVQDNVKIGTATAAASETGSTTITATLTQAPDPSKNLDFHLHGAVWDYTGQVGLLTGTEGNSISEKYDYAKAFIMWGDYTVSGNVISTDETLEFFAEQSIFKFTLVDKGNGDAAINATKLNIHSSDADFGVLQKIDNIGNHTIFGDLTITPDGTTNVIYTALDFNQGDMTLTANVGNAIYSYFKSSPSFDGPKFYDITVKMNKILARITGSNASAVLGGGYTAKSVDDAATLAKQCWTVAGGIVYVVYGIAGYNINYVKTEDGEATTTGSISVTSASDLYAEGSTAWFVEPALLSVTVSDPYSYAGGAKTIYYYSGETWGQAIENHSVVNNGWYIKNYDSYKCPTFTGVTNDASVYDGSLGDYTYYNSVIIGTRTYRFSCE